MAYRPQIKTANGMVDFPLDAETIKGKTILEQTYPVGAIYLSVNSTSPASLFGGTWERLKDRFLLGAGDTYSNGATGGSATHQLSIDEMPSHNHRQQYNDQNTGYGWYLCFQSAPAGKPEGNFVVTSTITTDTGGNKAHNNMPPYLVVNIWKRTA